MAVASEAFEARVRAVRDVEPHHPGGLGNSVPGAELADSVAFSAPRQIVPNGLEALVGGDARG